MSSPTSVRLLVAALLAGAATTASAAPPKAEKKAERPAAKEASAPAETPAKATLLDKVKPLAGTWTMTKDGKEIVALQSRMTSNGSVLMETMFPGAPHEMTNAYHLDGDKLVVTHYCAAGNQPRMETRGEKEPGVLHFTLRDATNVEPKGARVMGELTLTVKDADHLVQEWRSYAGGKLEPDIMRIELTRKK